MAVLHLAVTLTKQLQGRETFLNGVQVRYEVASSI